MSSHSAFPERMPYHLGIATNDLEQAMATLSEQLGCTWAVSPSPGGDDSGGGLKMTHPMWSRDGNTDAQRVRIAHSHQGPVHFELLEGAPGSIWHTDRLTELHHFGYWSRDVAGDVEQLGSRGWAVDLALRDDAGVWRDMAYLSHPQHLRVELIDVDWRYESYVRQTGDRPALSI